MLLALFLLLVALIVVLIKDRQLWMSSSSTPEPAVADQDVAPPPTTTNSQAAPASLAPPQAVTAPSLNKTKASKPHVRPQTAPVPDQTESSQADNGASIVATNRTVLPPLEVEVVAGNRRSPISPRSNSVKVDMDSSASVPTPTPAPPEEVPDTSAQVTLPHATAARVTRSVKPDYPLLAKQMKVQGAVVLQALIDKGGKIQELHVVTGPAILASAAQEAVKQWRFKPYYQQGQPVETEARITVNFTISTY